MNRFDRTRMVIVLNVVFRAVCAEEEAEADKDS